MTDRDREVLAALAEHDDFISVPVLRWKHPDLQAYTKGQLFFSMGRLVKDELVKRTIGWEREARYRITEKGHEFLMIGSGGKR